MAEGTFIKLIQNGKKPVMSTVIIQTEMLRRVCADGTENNINANASIGSGYVLVGRKHNDDDHGPTTIYEAKLEIIDQATGKKINGLKAEISAPTVFCKPGHGECGDWGETQFDGSSTNRVITSYRHYKGNTGDHNADENHGFTLLVAEIKLKSESTGQYITVTPFDKNLPGQLVETLITICGFHNQECGLSGGKAMGKEMKTQEPIMAVSD